MKSELDRDVHMKLVAIVPARGGSKRLPRKNILPVCGKPMIQWTIGNCINSSVFERIIVSTDDEEIAALSRDAGAEVVMRPDHMATDDAHEFDAYLHVLEHLKSEAAAYPDMFCGIYPTAALIKPEDYKNAYARFSESYADVLMSVTSYTIHPYKSLEADAEGYLKMVYPQFCKDRSQTYPQWVSSNGTFYFMRTKSFVQKPNYYPDRLIGYDVPPDRAVDVDTADDFNLLEFFMRRRLTALVEGEL